MVGARVWDLPDQSLTPNAPLLPRHLKLHDLFTDERRRARRRGDRPPAGPGQRATCASATPGSGRPPRCTATPPATNASTSRPAPAVVETVFGSLPSRQGDYVIIPRATTHRWVVPDGDTAGSTSSRPTATSARPEAVPVQAGPAARARPVLRTGPARPDEPLLVEGRMWRSTSSTAAPAPAASPAPSTSCPSTPSTSSAGTAASTRTRSTSTTSMPITGKVHQPPPVHQVFEGNNFVICNFVPRKVDYHPLVGPGALLPLQRRLRRGHVLRRRRLRGPQGLRHRHRARSPSTPAATPRPAAGRRGGQPRRATTSTSSRVMVDTFRPLDLGEAGPGLRRRQSTPAPGPGDGGPMGEPTRLAGAWIGFFDDAAVFPPGSAPLDAAVRDHLGRRSSPLAASDGASAARSGPGTCSPRLWPADTAPAAGIDLAARPAANRRQSSPPGATAALEIAPAEARQLLDHRPRAENPARSLAQPTCQALHAATDRRPGTSSSPPRRSPRAHWRPRLRATCT